MEYNASDLKAIEEGCYFDKDKAERAIRFVESYCIPPTIGKKITLLPWQKEIVSHLFGWYRPDGSFRYRRATVSTAKKNGA